MNRKIFSIILMTAFSTAVFTSCKEADKYPKEYNVTFESNGGSVASQTVKEGE